MACLLYCVTLPKPNVNVVTGVCENPVLEREMLRLKVYWSELAHPEECLGTAESLKKAAVQFHQVLRDILAAATPIPFCFPTLLESEEVLGQHLAREQEQYHAALERIGDALQYEVVGSWAADEQTDLATPISGREYLKRRSQGDGAHCRDR